MPYASGALSEIFDLQPDDVIEDAAPIFSWSPDDLGRRASHYCEPPAR